MGAGAAILVTIASTVLKVKMVAVLCKSGDEGAAMHVDVSAGSVTADCLIADWKRLGKSVEIILFRRESSAGITAVMSKLNDVEWQVGSSVVI